ncbi:MAG: ankyrin repeat domain-containing protein, partial [Nostocoides sp.]
FTALTGAFGGGEQGPRRQPPHAHAQRVARLLLDRGADPNDGQTLYNRMFTPANDHLGLLFEYGLGTVTDGPWFRLLGEAMETPAEMMTRQVRWAAGHGFTERLDLLADHGMDVHAIEPHRWEVPADIDARARGRTALHEAAWDGNLTRIRTLLDAGADPTVVDDRYGATPLAWAEHAFQTAAASLLRPLTPLDPQ